MGADGEMPIMKNHHHHHSWKNESFASKKKRILALYYCLKKRYPRKRTMLKYETPIQMLVATMLSAQTTDKKVNEVTQEKGLFKKYRQVSDFAKARLEVLQNEIRSLGFFRQKAKNIIAAAKAIQDRYQGKMPDSIEEMITLPGVARKTANIVLNHVYRKAEGIAVDTHMRQVAARFGMSKEQDPEKIEQDLMKIFPKKEWLYVSYVFVDYNRDFKSNIKPQCEECYLKKICQ